MWSRMMGRQSLVVLGGRADGSLGLGDVCSSRGVPRGWEDNPKAWFR